MTNERLNELARRGLDVERTELDAIERQLTSGARLPVLQARRAEKTAEPAKGDRKGRALTEAGRKQLSMVMKRRWRDARKQGRAAL